jgi:hypothetical protein
MTLKALEDLVETFMPDDTLEVNKVLLVALVSVFVNLHSNQCGNS